MAPRQIPVRRLMEATGLLLLAGFAFALSYATGQRGFFAFDQSPYFDGGYRVFQGQVPYLDFVTPMGVPAFVYLAFFFAALGVSWHSYLVAAAVGNVLAVMVSYLCLRLLAPRRRIVAYVGGVLTSVWFYPPFGTPSDVQTSFLVMLIGITAIVAARSGRTVWSRPLLALAGACAVIAFLSKQSAGLYAAPFAVLMILAGEAPKPNLGEALRRLGWWLAGGTMTTLAGAVWLITVSDPRAFWQHAVAQPASLGLGRFAGAVESPLLGVRFAWFIHLALLSTIPLAIDEYRRQKTSPRLAAIFALGAAGFSYLFVSKTLNHWGNGLPLLGMVLALELDLGLRWLQRWRAGTRQRRRWTVLWLGSTLVCIALSTITGLDIAINRRVHELISGAQFRETVAEPGLSILLWGEPTAVDESGVVVSRADLETLIADLRQRDQNFFVFPDFTILYGLLGRPSPQPYVWFQPNVTYQPDINPERDRRIIESLEKFEVDLVVIERASFLGWRLSSFPDLDGWIQENFRPVRTIGPFLVLERRGPSELDR